jgi:hypothetical protein
VLAVRVAGRGARVRLIVDTFQLIQAPIYGGLQRTVDHGDEYRWLVFDVARWKGHAAYLEFIDDGPGYIAVSEVVADDRPPANGPPDRAAPPATIPADDAPASKRIRELETRLAAPRRAPAMADGNGANERVFVRGNPKTPGEEVPRRFLELFGGRPFPSPGSGRRELAAAVTDPTNPLPARVMANRVWQHHFGVGLVPTPDDFGRQGQPPTHPELLDYLASEFVRGGWRVKPLHRLILTSETYRQASRPHPDSAAIAATADPQNRLMHRANVRRLEAEAVRDGILAVSGRLDRTVGGPGVPPHLSEHMTGRGRPTASGPVDGGGRRSVYQQIRRNFLPPLLTAFDYPTPFTTIGRRTVSNVPAQALALLNNPFVVEQAGRWADAVLRGPERSAADRVRRMYAEAFARRPTADELAAATEYVADREREADARAAWADLAHALFNAKAFVFLE